MNKKILLLSDNPLWSRDFYQGFKDLGKEDILEIIEFDGIRMPEMPVISEVALVYARLSPSATFRGKEKANQQILEVVRYFESKEIRVVNGSKAISYELDKSKQFALLKELGIPIPNTYSIRSCVDPLQIVEVASLIKGAFFVKPNIGGSGRGIACFDSVENFLELMSNNIGEYKHFFADGTVLVQEKIHYDDVTNPHLFRHEYINGKLYYTVKVNVVDGKFNNCAADACQDGFCSIEKVEKDKFTIVDVDFPYDKLVCEFLLKVGSDIAGIEFICYNGEWYCIDPNVANTNYGTKQEEKYNLENGKNLSGHRKVAEYLLGLVEK